jgi:hypothetical protein
LILGAGNLVVTVGVNLAANGDGVEAAISGETGAGEARRS